MPWIWKGTAPDFDKLVDHEGETILAPIGSWGCSPLRPDSHGIRVNQKYIMDIAKLPDYIAEAENTLKYYEERGRIVVQRDGNPFQRAYASAELHIGKLELQLTALKALIDTNLLPK